MNEHKDGPEDECGCATTTSPAAWDAIASHPFFRDCYATEGPLLPARILFTPSTERSID